MMYYDIIHWSSKSIQLSIQTFSAAYLIQGVSLTEAVPAVKGQEAEWLIYNKTIPKGQTAFHIHIHLASLELLIHLACMQTLGGSRST